MIPILKLYSYEQDVVYTPTSLLVHTRLIFIFEKAKLFDCLIKSKIPTSGCLLQSINGSLKLANLLRILWVNKALWLCYVHILDEVSIKECRLDIHLPYLIVIICGYGKQNPDGLEHDYW